MSRMRVGDIVIDGDRVRIGSVGTRSTGDGTGHVVQQPSPIEQFLAWAAIVVPVSGPTFLVLGGVLIAVAGLTLIFVARNLLLGDGAFSPLFLVAAIPTAAVGAAAFATGIFKTRAVAATRRHVEPDNALHLARTARLRPHLGEKNEGHTVRALAVKAGLTEVATVETLLALKNQGAVVEELNVDTGEWFYFSAPRGAEGVYANHLPLESRINKDNQPT